MAHFLNNPRPITLTYLTFVIEISQTPFRSNRSPWSFVCLRNAPGVLPQFPVVVQPTPLVLLLVRGQRRLVKEVRAQPGKEMFMHIKLWSYVSVITLNEHITTATHEN